MSIISFIRKVCKQTAVYWGAPVADGYGGFTFAVPVEIKVRWEDKLEVVSDGKGNEVITHAMVLVQQDVDLDGYLYLGTLASLQLDMGDIITIDNTDITIDDTTITINEVREAMGPIDIAGAYQIKIFEKIPLFCSSTKFVRKAYL